MKLIWAIFAALLPACSQLPYSIHATPIERFECEQAATGCSVWTDAQLNAVMAVIVQKSVEYGRALERGDFDD